MERQKMKISIEQGLSIVKSMIKDLAICNEMNVSRTWLVKRQNKGMSRNFQFSFKAEDVERVNQAIWRIGERLQQIHIEYTAERQQIIDQIRNGLSEVCMPYIYKEKLKKNKAWYANRMARTDGAGRHSSFSEEDVLNINFAVAEIAARLLSIELVVEGTN